MTDTNQVKSFSSINQVNEAIASTNSEKLLSASFTSREIDTNNDGKAEEINISLKFKTDPSKIRTISTILSFDYEI
jgi:hypothetical protein